MDVPSETLKCICYIHGYDFRSHNILQRRVLDSNLQDTMVTGCLALQKVWGA